MYTLFRLPHMPRIHARGFSLVEVIVVSALVTLLFGGLFSGVRLMVELVGQSKAEAGARSLAVATIEYIRSLPYDSIGTVGGIPDGPLAQTSTTTLNGITYTERILIQYLDRPEDGFGVDDENGVTEDSKVVKVEYSWNVRGKEESLALITDVIPQGIESTTGGGTLFINVFDADVGPVANADVRVFNDTGTSTIDVTVVTNANGIANFPGAPTLSGYQISATKSGYSTDQTYSATAQNPNPNPPHVSVLTGIVSTVNFSIDQLSSLTLHARLPAETGTFDDMFSDSSSLVSTTNTEVQGGALVLAGGSGSYSASGSARSASSSPSTLDAWQSFEVVGDAPTGTAYRVHLYSVSGVGTSSVYTLIPDSDLPGNSIGFTNGTVDITALDAETYPALALGADFSSDDPTVTPSLDEWHITHIESQQPVADATFSVRGAKTIGENGGSAVPKYTSTITTDANGDALLSDMEWDAYTISIDGVTEGFDIIEAYGILPYVLEPNVSEDLTLILDTHTTHSLHVTVVDTLGAPIENADVVLTLGANDETLETSLYGQTYFDDLTTSNSYDLSVTASGYDAYSVTGVSVSGTTSVTVTLTSL